MFKLEEPNQIELSRNYSAIIYGKPGIGKTTLALSAKNPVLLDFDSGIGRVDPNFWTAKLAIKDYREVLEFLESDVVCKFDTIVVDTVGACIDSMCSFLMENNPKLRNGGSLSLRGFGELKSLISNLIRTLKSQEKNLIFVAHEKEEDDGEARKIMRPNLGSGSGGRELVNVVDIIGYVFKEGGKSSVSFTPYDNSFIGKNSIDLPQKIEIPNPITLGKNEWFQNVVDKYSEKKRSRVLEMRREYEEAVKEIDLSIEKISDQQSCNQIYEYLTNDARFEKISTWKRKLSEKTKEMKRFEYVPNNA